MSSHNSKGTIRALSTSRRETASAGTRASAIRHSQTNRQRRALGALFFLLALGFAGIAFAAAASGSGGTARRAIVAAAAAALAVWLGTLAARALR
jgi:hypothetical protein